MIAISLINGSVTTNLIDSKPNDEEPSLSSDTLKQIHQLKVKFAKLGNF